MQTFWMQENKHLFYHRYEVRVHMYFWPQNRTVHIHVLIIFYYSFFSRSKVQEGFCGNLVKKRGFFVGSSILRLEFNIECWHSERKYVGVQWDRERFKAEFIKTSKGIIFAPSFESVLPRLNPMRVEKSTYDGWSCVVMLIRAYSEKM